MKNKIMIKLTALTVVFTMFFTIAASAVTLTDISDHWSKEYVEKAVEKGLVAGYEDGTYRPEQNVSLLESLVMLSRLYNIDEDIYNQIVDNYAETLKNMPNSSNYEWAFKELSVILELGVLSENALTKMFTDKSLGNMASKEEVAILMTKAMLLADEAKNLEVYVWSFKDVDKISTAARPYIYIMSEKGILTGDDKKNINPKNEIKRSEMATMLIRSYDYIQENEVMPEFENYKPTTAVNGIITDVVETDVESYIDVKYDVKDAEAVTVRINNKTKINLNGKSSSISKAKKGMLVKCKVREGNIAAVVDLDSLTEIVNGTISYVSYVQPAKIAIINESGKQVEYNVPYKDVSITYNGKETELKNLNKRDTISIRVKNDVVYQIDSISRVKEYKGKIANIEYKNPIEITIKTTIDGKEMKFMYQNETTVTRNGEESSFDQIRVGDEVTVVTEYDKMSKISTKATQAQLSGTIKEIYLGDVKKVKIADKNGEAKEYLVSNNVKINLGSKSATIYDLRVGYTVDVNLSGDYIVTMDAAEVQSTLDFSGEVIFINENDKVIMIVNSTGESLKLNITSSTKIFNSDGKTMYLKDIKMGDYIKGFYKYENGNSVVVSIML